MKPRRRSRRGPQVRLFRCPVCGNTMPATKMMGRTIIGHIKTMHCLFCGEVQDFIQVD